jgi:hypothetical protein
MQRNRLNVVLTVVLSLLLLGMQLEGQRHALQHLADQLHRSHEQGLQLPQSEVACPECALLAGASNVISGSSTMPSGTVAATERFDARFVSRGVVAPSYYLSRAPPVFL